MHSLTKIMKSLIMISLDLNKELLFSGDQFEYVNFVCVGTSPLDPSNIYGSFHIIFDNDERSSWRVGEVWFFLSIYKIFKGCAHGGNRTRTAIPGQGIFKLMLGY